MKRKATARDEAPDGDEAPDAFDEEEATRQAKRMKSEELRAALEAAGVDDTDGNKPALVERLVASHGAFAGPAGLSPMFEGSGAGGGGWDPPFAQGHSASSPSTPRAPLPAASPTADPILLGGGSR